MAGSDDGTTLVGGRRVAPLKTFSRLFAFMFRGGVMHLRRA